jgi:hypothetical protein
MDAILVRILVYFQLIGALLRLRGKRGASFLYYQFMDHIWNQINNDKISLENTQVL